MSIVFACLILSQAGSSILVYVRASTEGWQVEMTDGEWAAYTGPAVKRNVHQTIALADFGFLSAPVPQFSVPSVVLR